MKNKILRIAIDPGFDCVKICIEGHLVKFPFNVLKVALEDIKTMTLNDSYILYKEDTKTYYVGDYARMAISSLRESGNLSEEMGIFYSSQRFNTQEFSVGLKAAVGYALISYAKHEPKFNLSKLDEYEVHVIVTLPHSMAETFSDRVKNILADKPLHIELKCGNDISFTSIDLSLRKENVSAFSQTLAAFINETINDKGISDDAMYYELSENGPTLVIDGGYETVGLVVINRGMLDNARSESNERFAMKNINECVMEGLAGYEHSLQTFTLEQNYKTNNFYKAFNRETRKVETIDLSKLKIEKARELGARFIEYLNNNYRYMLDLKHVIVTGGTGEWYYNQLKEYYVTENGFLEEDQMIKSSNTLNGEEFAIEYTIAVGAYKGLLSSTK